jgi:hypothetical protein
LAIANFPGAHLIFENLLKLACSYNGFQNLECIGSSVTCDFFEVLNRLPHRICYMGDAWNFGLACFGERVERGGLHLDGKDAAAFRIAASRP